MTQTVTVHPRPLAFFQIPPDVCGPIDITVVETSQTTANSTYVWNWDSPTSLPPNINIVPPFNNEPTIVIPENNTGMAVDYDILMEVTDNNGCIDTLTQSIILYPEPDAGFIPIISDSCGSYEIDFINTSLANNVEPITSLDFQWSVDNSLVGNTQDLNYVFTNPTPNDVSYDIALTISTLHGCNDTIAGSVIVYPDPISEFVLPSSACAPFTLDASNVILPNSYPEANDDYNWYIDGVLIGTGPSFPSYDLLDDGDTLDVMLVTSNDHGCASDTMIQTYYTIEDPVADFDSNLPACSPYTVTFTNNSTSNINYLWDFGDGLLSTDVEPTHTFDNPSYDTDITYTVTLSVDAAGSGGCSDITTDVITVLPTPLAGFILSSTSVCADTDSITVDNNTTQIKGPATYQWSVNDPTATISDSLDPTPTFTFADNQTGVAINYDITLLATCLLYTSPSPRDGLLSRMPSSA